MISDPSANLKTLEFGLAPDAPDDDIDVQSEEMLVNMGPQHPSTHGVLRIVLRTDGEVVLEAVPHLGWVKEYGNRNFVEYPLAVLELHRIEEAKAKGHGESSGVR